VGDLAKVLIVDDDAAVTNYLMVFLVQSERFDPVVANDSISVPALLDSEKPDLVILDMDMPGLSGVDILRHIHDTGMKVPVIILTGVSDVDLAVKAMKLGAFDYLIKPADDEKLLETLDRAIEHHALSCSLDGLAVDLSRDDLANRAAFETFIASEPSILMLFHQAEKIAAGDSSVFILGEHGTGKEALARAIHSASRRRGCPFVAFDAAAVPAEDLSTELFGQVRDFSGREEDRSGFLEAASGGTLFLNSIERLSLPVQVRLRRVIQNAEFYRERSAETRRIDVRLIVSTTVDLAGEEYRDSFDRDLLYHLMVNSIRIPPLREHPGDIPLLAEHFSRISSEKAGKPFTTLSGELLSALGGYDFPGNIEELESIVSYCILNSEPGVEPGPESLPPFILVRMMEKRARPGFVPRKLRDVVAQHIEQTLTHVGRDRVRAAAELGLTAGELDRLLEDGSPGVTPPAE
jgi:DNA-binding NtrC family response regulator